MIVSSLLLILGTSLVAAGSLHADAGAGSDAESIEVFTPFELVLQSRASYDNPYLDVDLNGTFACTSACDPTRHNRRLHSATATDADSLTVPGFWAGGGTFRIRFSPPYTGVWTFSTSSSNPSDTGLNNITGNFTAVPYTGDNPFAIHGPLVASQNNRYLMHQDGTPFYWLGDTNWAGFNDAEVWNKSNNATFSATSMFKGIVDTRAQQGYTVWKAETFAVNNEGGNPPTNEGGPAWVDGKFFELLNTGFWDAIDNRAQYVLNRNIALSFANGIGRGMTEESQVPDVKRLIRYAVARLAAFPGVIWITCQEYCASACASCWGEVAAYQYALDPYKRANSLHNCAENPIAFHDQEWYSFVTLQQGHNSVKPVDHWLEQYNAVPPRPVVEDEANYEQIIQEYGGDTEWMTRQSAWQSQIGGAFGFTYGGQGIWWGCYDFNYSNANCGPVGSQEYRVWWQTLVFPIGGYQLTYMKSFWTSLPWWTLAPNDTAITWYGAPAGNQRPYQKTSPDGAVVVAYLPVSSNLPQCGGGIPYNGAVNSLSPGRMYSAQWFDPRTGNYSTIAGNITGTASFQFPRQPDPSVDWVLLVKDIGPGDASVKEHRPSRHTGPRTAVQRGATTPESAVSAVTAIVSLGSLRGDSSIAGCNFTAGSQGLTVSALGKYLVPGDFFTHVLSLLTSSGETLSYVTVNMTASAPDRLGFVYAALDSPVHIAPGSSFFVAGQNVGCGQWYDDVHTVLQTTPDVTIDNSVYTMNAVWVSGGGGRSTCYGPMSFLYTV